MQRANETTASFTVTVGDTEAPVISGVPANITRGTDAGAATAVVTFTPPTASDNVAVTGFTQTAGLASGSAFPVGITTNRWRAVDAAGNETTASFTVTVADGEAPVLIGMPVNRTVNTDAGLPTAVLTWAVPTATDNSGVVTVTRTAGPAPGSALPIGSTTIVYVARDGAGNETRGSFMITVVDAEAPVIAGTPANISRDTDRGRNTAAVTWTEPTASDNSGTVTLVRTAGLASGSSFPIGTTTVTYTATDTAGNATHCELHRYGG
jgi:hypothetical protein